MSQNVEVKESEISLVFSVNKEKGNSFFDVSLPISTFRHIVNHSQKMCLTDNNFRKNVYEDIYELMYLKECPMKEIGFVLTHYLGCFTTLPLLNKSIVTGLPISYIIFIDPKGDENTYYFAGDVEFVKQLRAAVEPKVAS